MNKELIKITTNDKGEQLVSGRELHEFLGVKSRFNDWINNRIKKYDFIEDADYTKILVQCIRGQNEYDYALTIDMAKELSMVENSDKGRQARKYFIECEKKLKEIDPRANLLLAIYNGGEAGVLASKKLTELEVQAATKPLIEEIEHKEEVIVGLVDEIDVADKRQILNRVVRYKTKNYKERWNSLYREFDNKYHMDSNRRYHNYKESGQKPKVAGRLDYIDRVMGMIPQLYEIACKLYKSDVEELVQQMYELRK